MRGLRKTGREGEENSKAALGFAREDANHRRRGRSKPVAPTTAEDNVNGKGESQKRLLAACATRATSTAGPKTGGTNTKTRPYNCDREDYESRLF